MSALKNNNYDLGCELIIIMPIFESINNRNFKEKHFFECD